MTDDPDRPRRFAHPRSLAALLIGLFLFAPFVAVLNGFRGARDAHAHIIPPENFHPVAAAYRRMTFILNLNPILWERVRADAETIAAGLIEVEPTQGGLYRRAVAEQLDRATGAEPPDPETRRAIAARVFELSTRAVSLTAALRLTAAERALDDYAKSSAEFNTARKLWKSFEHEVQATDPPAFARIGIAWLELGGALGNPGIMRVAAMPPDRPTFAERAAMVRGYLTECFGPNFKAPEAGPLAPLPRSSATFLPGVAPPVKLPPGHDINKQIPRPRQILNLIQRGADERETALIALGDMAFDSAFIFGEPARSLNITCNTCHNKGVTNPNLFIPGLSGSPGTVDVSSSFFAPHANNGHFDPLDIPDLRGIRFTAPYGRNGRFESLREFARNVIVNEFDGPEPDPMMLDAMVAYMMEFDFLPNPALDADGSLNDSASESARRGELIFGRPFERMGGRSCATCHVPSDNFLDRKRHDIGTARGSDPDSRDRALDTPTLLSARFTPPYFHDGSQPTLRAVNQWFNHQYKLGLSETELDDLTAYVETVGDGVESYEGSPYYLAAELEEFAFFLSTYETLERKNKPALITIVFQTIAGELRNHKWELQDTEMIPVMERMAELMDEARAAHERGDPATTAARVAEYRKMYEENAERLN
jgi:cytochrome c peroxidase